MLKGHLPWISQNFVFFCNRTADMSLIFHFCKCWPFVKSAKEDNPSTGEGVSKNRPTGHVQYLSCYGSIFTYLILRLHSLILNFTDNMNASPLCRARYQYSILLRYRMK